MIKAESVTVENWRDVSEGLPIAGMPRIILSLCKFESFNNDTLILRLQDGEIHLASPRFIWRIQDVLCRYFGKQIKVEILVRLG